MIIVPSLHGEWSLGYTWHSQPVVKFPHRCGRRRCAVGALRMTTAFNYVLSLTTSTFMLLALIFAIAVQDKPIFEELRTIESADRIMAARTIYKASLRHADSTAAFQGLAELRTVARQLDDKPLECSVYDLQADYFSVNRGFNELSLKYYRDAIAQARKYDLPAYVASHTYKLGTFYNTFGKYAEANRYFIDALDQFRKVGYEQIPRIGIYLLDISNFYYKVGDFETSRDLAIEALANNDRGEDQELNMTNTIALCNQALGDETEALNFFFKALKAAEVKKDSVWMGILLGNIGTIYYHQGEYARAQPMLESGYLLTMKSEPVVAVGSVILLASNHMSKGEMKDAEKYIRLADQLVVKVNKLVRWADYHKMKARWHELRGETHQALASTRLFGQAKDSLLEQNNLAEVERVKWRWEMDKHQADLARVEARASTERLTRNFIIALLFLLMIISILAYNRRLIAKRTAFDMLLKEEELLKSEKERAEEALRHASNSLGFFTESLREKNKIIEEFKAEIERLHNQAGHAPDEERLRQLDQLIQSHIMTDEAWRKFQQLFERVHYGFIARLRTRFEIITETDIRLLALIKLGLNNREMSNALGVTLEAIKKARQRLKKKIELPEEESLEQVVATI